MGQAEGTLGAQLEDRYFRQKVKLGQGSFGTVWRAVDRHSGDTVAIKQLDKANMPRRKVTRQDIDQEIALMKAVKHQNVIQLFGTYEDSSSIYLALEYCEDGDFGDKIKEQGLGMEEKEAAEWMRQICDAVCVLHTQNICHRDIKPDNFLIHRRTTLKLSDFGLATVIKTSKLLQHPCGTPAFNAPEQHPLSKSAGYSLPVDMWAVGVSMYMVMFGGKHPFADDKSKLDESLLLAGKLDFRDHNSTAGRLGLGGVGGVGLRFSEEARQFCRRMVDLDPQRRLAASEAIYEPWLRLGALTPARSHTQCSPARPSSRPPSRTPSASRGAQSPGHRRVQRSPVRPRQPQEGKQPTPRVMTSTPCPQQRLGMGMPANPRITTVPTPAGTSTRRCRRDFACP